MSGVLEGWFTEAWRLSWQGSALIILILLTQALAQGKLPARWRYRLWLLVVARLLLPVSWPSRLSVYNAVEWGAARAGAALAPISAVPAEASFSPVMKAAPTPEGRQVDVGAAPALAPIPSGPAVRPIAHLPRSFASAPGGQPLFAWRRVVALAWAAGALALAARVLVTTLGMRRRIRQAAPMRDPELLALLEECRGRMGVCARLTVRETSAIQSPALFGLFRLELLLPLGLARNFSVEELRHIFLHELAHLRRRDLPMNWLLTFLQVIHWFNPVLWFGLARMRADRELACDALVLAGTGGAQAREYGRTIIKLLESAARPATAPGLVGILESKSQMVRRIRMIAHFRGPQRWPLLAIGLTAVLALIGLTDAARTVRAVAAKAGGPEKTLRVTVLDAGTGEPIFGAALRAPFSFDTIARQPLPPVRTDARGVAVIPAVDFSGFLAVHPDYAPAAVMAHQEVNGPPPPAEYTMKLERGATIGGIVREEGGPAPAGLRVEIAGTRQIRPRQESDPPLQQYPAYSPEYCQGAVTDAEGRWSCPHFPAAVEVLQLKFIRADGSCVCFHSETPPGYSALSGSKISMEESRQGNLVCVLPKGIDVRGIVRDAAGQPLAGITVTERDRRRPTPIAVVKTGADGRFSLPQRDPHQILLLLTGDGLATAARVVKIEPGLAEQVFEMAPARTLRLRVMDEAGRPIKGTTLDSPELELGWKGTTDAQGRAAWPAAPRDPQVYRIGAEKYRGRLVRLAPAEEEAVVTLQRGEDDEIHVTIKPRGEDGRPLPRFTVSVAYEGNFMGRQGGFEPLAEGREGICSARVPVGKVLSGGYWLKVAAPGLVPYVSGRLWYLDGEPLLSPTLSAARPARPIEGRVLLPDGKPAAEASVILMNTEGPHSSVNLIFFPGHVRPEGHDTESVRTDADGRYTLPPAAPETVVLVIHDQGTLATTAGAMAQKPELLLQPWGIVEGTLTVNGRPRAGQRVDVQQLTYHLPDHGVRLTGSASGETDQAGHFRIAQVPVGGCTVYTTAPGANGGRPVCYPTQVMVQSGTVTHVDCHGNGRPVAGRVQLSSTDAEIDWQKDLRSANLKAIEEEDAQPAYEDFVQQADYLGAFGTHFPHSGMPASYLLDFEPDGSFHAEGVPPGKYQIELIATRSGTSRQEATQDIGTLQQEVIVPSGGPEAAANLGAFTLPLTGEVPRKRPAVSFSARTLTGQPLTLADDLGKQVLLLFWATWAPPSAETLAQWQRLYEEHGTDPRFAILGVSLDDDAAGAAQFATAHGWLWPQARLEGSQKAAVTEKLEVDNLPAAVLLGPDGRVAGRDLSEARLRTAIEAFLTSAK